MLKGKPIINFFLWYRVKRKLTDLYYPICSQCTLSLLSENMKKHYSFLSSDGGGKVNWEQMSKWMLAHGC